MQISTANRCGLVEARTCSLRESPCYLISTANRCGLVEAVSVLRPRGHGQGSPQLIAVASLKLSVSCRSPGLGCLISTANRCGLVEASVTWSGNRALSADLHS